MCLFFLMYSKVTYLFNSVILQLAKNRSLAKGEAVSTKNLLVYIELNFDSNSSVHSEDEYLEGSL